MITRAQLRREIARYKARTTPTNETKPKTRLERPRTNQADTAPYDTPVTHKVCTTFEYVMPGAKQRVIIRQYHDVVDRKTPAWMLERASISERAERKAQELYPHITRDDRMYLEYLLKEMRVPQLKSERFWERVTEFVEAYNAHKKGDTQ